MSIEVTSNFKTAEVDPAIKAGLAGDNKKSDENKSVSVNSDEINEESGASEVTQISEDESLESDESDNDQSENEDERPKKKGGFQKRIGKLTAKISAKDQEIEYWKEQALKGKIPDKPQVETAKEAKSLSGDGKPDPNNFDTNAEYIEALTDWKLEQKETKAKADKQIEQVKSEYQKQNEAHQSRVNEFKKQKPDFDDVVGEFLEEHGDVQFSPAVEELVLSSELSGAIVYEFAKNKKELDRLNSLSPLAAAREFGKLELKLSKETDSNKTVEVKTSKAPPPITPVGSKGSGASRKTIFDAEDQSEYEALRREQMKARRA